MIKQFILYSILFILATSNCHYSCSNCTGKSYISCLKCYDNKSINVVQNPSAIPRQYWSSLYPSGTCIDTTSTNTNGFGVFLFLFLTIICLIIRTKQSFYLYLTIQTFGLYNLIQIGWINPIGYILQSMQYLMIWNIIGSGYKTNDYVLMSNKNYRLNRFLRQAQIGQNIALIAAFTLISLVLLIIICIISIRRKKQANSQQKKNEKKNEIVYQNLLNQSDMDRAIQQTNKDQVKQQTCACWKSVTEGILVQIAKFLIVVLYFMIQETMVVLLVSLVFLKPVKANIILLCIVYLHMLVFIMSYGYYYRIQYFKEKKTMYINFAKKVILPVMVVVPITHQYLIFIFAIGIFIIEFLIDNSNNVYEKFNRLVLYKILQIIIIILLCIYYLVEGNARSANSSRAASVACTLFIALFLALFVIIQLPLGIKAKYFDQNDDKNSNELTNNNQITLEQINCKDTKDQRQNDSLKKQFAGVQTMSNQNQEQQQQQQQENSENQENNNRDIKIRDSNIRDGNIRDSKIRDSQIRDSKIRDSNIRDSKNSKDKQQINIFDNLQKDIVIQQLEDICQKKNDKFSKDDNNSMVTKNIQQTQQQKQQAPRQNPVKKRKRRQIIDKQLRLRYGI